MGKKLYKYLGQDVLELVFSEKGIAGFKCSKPKDYNDPYELFLSIDRNLSSEYLAAYQEFVGELPQLPTSCFSQSPVVVPMWAHYANLAQGFVIEVDEDKLKEFYDEFLSISDVVYSEEPNEDIFPSLQRAVITCKPRHTFYLRKTIFYSAYFYKQLEWAYEKERRVVVHDDDIISIVNGSVILQIPNECITAIICGENTNSNNAEVALNICRENGIVFYRSFIGKSYAKKFMCDEDGRAYVFDGEGLVISSSVCTSCKEPFENAIKPNQRLCSWCSITDSQRYDAAGQNPYRVLGHLGLLDAHIQGMTNRSRGIRK